MKILKSALAIFISLQVFSQNTKHDSIQTKHQPNLFISGGSHIGFIGLYSDPGFPLNFQFDVRVSKNFYVGLGYQHDTYHLEPITSLLSWNATSNPSRYYKDNVNLRFYSIINSTNETVKHFIGGSIGLSYWSNSNKSSNEEFAIPTAQFIYGFRIKITKSIFNQTEISLGPPCAFKTSFGISF